jgi:hypothetical protein
MGDVDGLVEASRRMIEEPGLRARLAAGARARAIAEFDDSLMAQRSLDLYKSLMHQRPPTIEVKLSEWVHEVNRVGPPVEGSR